MMNSDQHTEFSPLSETNTVSPNSPPPSRAMPFIPRPNFGDMSPETSKGFGAEFFSMYRALFPPKPSTSPLPSSLSLTPSTRSSSSSACGFFGEESATTEHRLNQARLILERQQLSDHYDLCQKHLLCLTKEIDFLRRENSELRSENADLLKILSSPSAFRAFLLNSSASSAVTDAFSGLDIVGASSTSAAAAAVSTEKLTASLSPDLGQCSDGLSDISPTSVMESGRFEVPQNSDEVDRVSLPKSISVRSTDYQKMPIIDGPNRSTRPRPLANQLVPGAQKVYVPAPGAIGENDESEESDGGVELDVYNQGMLKTELCNKWQQTGTCPYGSHCQFAHGITELRPVIRHPRYKTEICRMVLSGDRCPYGHRCHFRHSLTDEERALLSR